MRERFFHSPESLQALAEVANSWIGTPFRQNGRVKGPQGGVSCHLLVGAIYAELDVLPDDIVIPDGPAQWARTQGTPIMETFMSEHPIVSQVFNPLPAPTPEPGDLLGFRVGKIIHHLAILIDGQHLIHCYMQTGVILSRLDDDTYASRLAAVWRPMLTLAHLRYA